jgi:hypothetical protein
VRPLAHRQAGQATVELVALLPALVLCAAVVWQLALAGQAAWGAGAAARAPRGPTPSAPTPARPRPGRCRTACGRGLRVRATATGEVGVTVAVPSVLSRRPLTTVTSRARFAPQR